MSNHNESLIVHIDVGDGTLREALPVRAIPYVTGWRANGGISPDVVATSLRPSTDGHGERLNGIFSYKLVAGKPYQISPQEWDMVAVQLAGFSAELEKQFPSSDQNKNDNAGYATWQTNATEKLPAGVFVWLDELKTAYSRFFDWQARVLMDESIVAPELNLTPLLLAEKANKMVLEGFEVAQSEASTTKTINGREVVPLRLLPFASHWLTAMTVAQSLAHKNPNEDLKLTGYYQSGNKLISMRPRQWDELVERLRLLEKALQHDEKSKFEDANYMRYLSESRALLPADVVIDCDELKAAYFNVFLDEGSDGPGYLTVRPGDNDLDLDCYLSEEERRMVFGAGNTQDKQKQEIESPDSIVNFVASSQQAAPVTYTASEKQAATTESINSAIMKPIKEMRLSWRDVSWLYVVEVFKEGQFDTAKVFYKALMSKAGTNNSPFDKGTGTNAGSLFVREINKTLAIKTIENAWADIKASRKTS